MINAKGKSNADIESELSLMRIKESLIKKAFEELKREVSIVEIGRQFLSSQTTNLNPANTVSSSQQNLQTQIFPQNSTNNGVSQSSQLRQQVDITASQINSQTNTQQQNTASNSSEVKPL